MEVTSGLSVRFREEVAEQRPEYPTTHRILEPLMCRHSCETLGEQFQPADSYLHLFLTFKSKSFTKGGL